MRINEHLELLSVKAWGDNCLNLAVLHDNDSAAIFDAALPGSLQAIQAEFRQAAIPFEKLNRVFITHHDFDHIGGLPELTKAASRPIQVLAHAEEQPYIEGKKPALKSDPDIRARIQKNLPAGQTLGPNMMIENPPKVPVDVLLSDGQFLDFCGGITVIHTPGHTPGHLCYYLNASKVLVAGDAMVAVDGKLQRPHAEHSVDINLAVESLKKLAQFDITAVICCHGGLCTVNINQQIRELAD